MFQANKGGWYIALNNYEPRQTDDLCLTQGSTVLVVDSSDPDWWKVKSTDVKEMTVVVHNAKVWCHCLQGSCDGQFGFFPASHVMLVRKGERVMQVVSKFEILDKYSNVPVKLLKDQASARALLHIVHAYWHFWCFRRLSFKKVFSPTTWWWSEPGTTSACLVHLATFRHSPYPLN